MKEMDRMSSSSPLFLLRIFWKLRDSSSEGDFLKNSRDIIVLVIITRN